MKSIVITSGKGGVGKTTVTTFLGRALSELGFRTVIIDTDFGLNNLDVVCGVENRITYDLCDCLMGRCRPRQALLADSEARLLSILPSVGGYLDSSVTSQNIAAVLKSLAVSFDYALVDCPAGVELGFHRAVAACERAIVVTTPHASAVRDADKVIKLLDAYGLSSDVIINRMRTDLRRKGKMPSETHIGEALNKCITTVIAESDQPGFKDKKFKSAFMSLARRIVNSSQKSERGGFLSRTQNN